MPAFAPADVRSLAEAFFRALDDPQLSDSRRALLSRVLSSPELDDVRSTWRRGTAGSRADPSHDAGSNEGFVQAAYQCLLARAADEGGLRHYVAALDAGETHIAVLRALTLSAEFERRASAIPQDTQLCELANPAKWDNGDWLSILRSLGLADDKLSMHRKPYEFTQLIYGCRKLGALRPDASIVSIGAGHEMVLYWLANHARRVVATDMYEGVWQDKQGREGDPSVLRRPEDYAPFDYRRDRLVFLKMDGRRLAFRDGTFDIAYSLSSIEHFGGVAGAVDTIREMARVLKPGGVLALATEYVLAGPRHPETFLAQEIHSLIDQPGLELVEPIDESVYRRYTYTAVDLYNRPYQTPHMVVRFGDTVFTTVMIFLRRIDR
jgi:SAM-dependent methyltransferase